MPGLQKQMLFMRCAYESQLDALTIFPFPGLKIVNIRGKLLLQEEGNANYYVMFVGNALLTLDLIIINHFISRLQSDNLLLELSLRDQVREDFVLENVFLASLVCLLNTLLRIVH